MIWTGLACLNQFINSIVWRGNAINWSPIWCDISAKFATVRTVTISKAEKRRAVYIDLAIGLGLPVLEMILRKLPILSYAK